MSPIIPVDWLLVAASSSPIFRAMVRKSQSNPSFATMIPELGHSLSFAPSFRAMVKKSQPLSLAAAI
jgi:hypothetical protein